MTPRSVAGAAGLALALLLSALPAAQAAEQPREAPAELRTGQSTAFGSIVMEPYVPAAEGPRAAVPVEARVVLRDLDALGRASTLLFALNLHSAEADLTVDGVVADDGRAVPPLRTDTGEGGLQQQVFVDAHEVARHAADGAVALTVRGHATPHHRGQVHVGTLVVAYDADWVPVQSSDGPAQLYAYSLVQSMAGGGGPMPFHGEGNSLLVLPVAALSALVLVVGALAIQALRDGAEVPPMPSLLPLSPRPVPASPAAPARPAPPPTAVRTVLLGRTEIELAGLPVFGSPPVPVFGSPESPPLRKRIAPLVGVAPVQGPLLPPDWRPPAQAAGPPKPPAPTPVAPEVAGPKPPAVAAPPVALSSPAVPPKEEPKPAAKATPARPSPTAHAAKPAPTAVRRPKRPAKRPARPSPAASKAKRPVASKPAARAQPSR